MTTKKNKITSLIKRIDTYLFLGLISFLRRKLLKLISIKQVNNNNFFYQTHYNNRINELNLLCDKYGSDKGYSQISKRTFYNNWHPHTYTDLYSDLFDHCKDKIEKVFECGIGTNTNLVSGMGTEYKPGASLRVWRDYFFNAEIYGADIDENILFKEDRINTFYVDQLDSASIKNMFDSIGKVSFDLMIDDGLHTFESGKTLFENSFHMLKENGIYIIEDVSHLYLYRFVDFFKDYNSQIIRLRSRKNKLLEDNNLIMIRK